MGKGKSARSCECPVAAFQKMISGKYKLRIIWDLQAGPRRYGEIRSGLLRGGSGSSEIAPGYQLNMPSPATQKRTTSFRAEN